MRTKYVIVFMAFSLLSFAKDMIAAPVWTSEVMNSGVVNMTCQGSLETYPDQYRNQQCLVCFNTQGEPPTVAPGSSLTLSLPFGSCAPPCPYPKLGNQEEYSVTCYYAKGNGSGYGTAVAQNVKNGSALIWKQGEIKAP